MTVPEIPVASDTHTAAVVEAGAIGEADNAQVLQRFFSRGGSIRMLADIDLADVEILNTYATQLFESGQIEGARNIYLVLVSVDQWHFDCHLALGRCYQRLEQHEEAIYCFSRSGAIKVDDPRSSYFAGISYRITGNLEYASKAFNAAIRWCGSRGEHDELKREATQLLALCVKEK
jgi:secretion system chaperone SscA